MTPPTRSRLRAGDLVVGRHRLLREVARGPGTTLWQAEDEVLARPVAVRVLDDPEAQRRAVPAPPRQGGAGPDQPGSAPGLPEEFLAAALRAGQVSDPRVASVYDAGDDDGLPVVVREWVEGQPLPALLREGPLATDQVVALGVQAASALAAAHARGLAHGALHPGDVVVTAGGVKLTDLETAAVLDGRPCPADPSARAAEDCAALGAVLYAACTARWPHGAAHGLPAAPETDGRRCTPHQVRAAVPLALDAVVTDAMAGRYASAEALVTDLVPLASGHTETLTALREPLEIPAVGAPLAPADAAGGRRWEPGDTGRGGGWRRAAVALVVLAMVAAGGWTMGLVTGELDDRVGFGRSAEGLQAAGAALVRPVEVRDFDPPPGDGQERPGEVRFVTDGDPGTVWTTDTYRGRPDLGGLKPGVGLLLDLGEEVPLQTVALSLQQSGGSLEVRAGTEAPARADDLPLVVTAADPPEELELGVAGAGPVRYLLVWFTSLPPRGDGYGAGVRQVVLERAL